jgi:hypothetical protein
MLQEGLLRKSPSAVSAEEDGRLVLYNPATGGFFALNKTGQLVWEALENWTTAEQISSRLALKYNLGVEIARRDADKFLSSLAERGLIDKQVARVK